MVPRALFDIFAVNNDDDQNSCKISISFAEIYNEKIYDLLAGPNDIAGCNNSLLYLKFSIYLHISVIFQLLNIFIVQNVKYQIYMKHNVYCKKAIKIVMFVRQK